MKKKILAAASLLLPVTILCACGGTPTQAFSANWHRDTAIRDIQSGTSEKLEYAVTFEPSDSKELTLAYESGTYTTELTAMAKQLPDGDKTETVYRYATKLDVKGAYTLNGAEKTFRDSVESLVYFRSITNGLQPIESTKHVISTSPTGVTTEIDKAVTTYDYTFSVNYTNPLSKANVKFVQTLPAEAEKEKTVSLGKGVNHFDNEQLEFILRGLDMASAVTLKTINPLDMNVTSVAMTETPKEKLESSFSFTMNGEAVTRDIVANEFSFGYKATNPGQAVTLVYAKKTDNANNAYRNVMLRRSVPVMQNLGTVHYTLVKADFIQ